MSHKKVCMVSSTGGHFMELMQLIPALDDINFYIVTETRMDVSIQVCI